MKRFFFFLLICFCSMTAPAQSPQNKAIGNTQQSSHPEDNKASYQRRIEEMRLRQIAYYTDKIGLTAEEAQAFWPVFYDRQNKRWKIDHERRKFFRMAKDNKAIEYERANARMIELRIQEAEMEKECYEKLKAILSPEKLFKYYQAEEDFSRELLRSFEGRRNRE